jgi:HSP20 family protein
MSNGNQSFFERLTGTVNLDEDERQQAANEPQAESFEDGYQQPTYNNPAQEEEWQQEPQAEETGQLAIDLYETPEHVVIQTMVPGVRPDQLDVSITRDHCTISGHRDGPRDVTPEDYYHQELYWGSFTRSVALPEEVEVDAAEASESHGLLTITLPKIKKDRETKLEVHSG